MNHQKSHQTKPMVSGSPLSCPLSSPLSSYCLEPLRPWIGIKDQLTDLSRPICPCFSQQDWWCFFRRVSVCVYLMFVYICIYPIFLTETGEAVLEECPNNKRDRKTLEEFILKRVQLGTKISADWLSCYKHFQELGCVVFVCCWMTLMLTSHLIIGISSTIQRILESQRITY